LASQTEVRVAGSFSGTGTGTGTLTGKAAIEDTPYSRNETPKEKVG
jgi:hypothetical protein